MDTIFNEIFRAIEYLIATGVVLFVWERSKNYLESGSSRKLLFQGFLICSGIALIFSWGSGEGSCVEYDYSMQGQYCVEYENDTDEPSANGRAGHYDITYLPVVLAVLFKDDQLMNSSS